MLRSILAVCLTGAFSLRVPSPDEARPGGANDTSANIFKDKERKRAAELSRQHNLTLYRQYMRDKIDALNSSCVVRMKPTKVRHGFWRRLPESGAVVFAVDDPFVSSDASVGRGLKSHRDLDNARVLAMASEDWIGSSHRKLTILPIGISSKLLLGQGGLDELTHFLDLVKNPKDFAARNHTLLSDAQLEMHGLIPKSGFHNDRLEMVRNVNFSVVDDKYTSKIPFIEHLDRVADAKFALCPAGNGLDTHRFYYYYALGTRCIVREGPLSQMHAEFPGTVVVKSWRDVTAENLAKWSREPQPAFRGELLTAEHWIARALRNTSCRPRGLRV